MGYIILLIFILITFISLTIYLTKYVHNTLFIKNMKHKTISWLISLVPILLIIKGLRVNTVNATVVYIHIFLFILLGELLIYLINKISKKEVNKRYALVFSLIVTSIYLGYGYYMAHHVVETHYEVVTSKDIGIDHLRVVQVTDSHIGATMDGDKFIEYMERINETNPDIVVVTGDFVDDSTSLTDMIKGCTGLGKLKTKYGVYFVYGNHDKGYFDFREYGDKEIREELAKNNVIILEDEYISLIGNVVLLGRQDKGEKNRVTAQDLMKDIDKNKYVIALDHEPNDYDNEAASGMDIVISGHTHGGQLFPLGPISLLLKENDKVYGIEKRSNTTFIVSSGIGDWAVKFKTDAKAEYVVIDIKNGINNEVSDNILEIVDETVTNNLTCDTALEKFYTDNDYTYYFSCIKSDYVIVKYEDGTTEKVVDAINNNKITIKELDKYNINYYKEKN